jgi:putative aminopeptidase FrvX
MTELVELLQELTAIPALAGREEAMIAAMRRHFEPLADDVRVDRIGNVIATVHGAQASPRLLVFAHMDELGLIVRKIDADGFVRVERVGGVPEKSLLSQWLEIHTDDGRRIPALMGATSHHVTKPELKLAVPSRLDMYVDVGCSSRAEVEALGVRVGDPITYRASFTRLSADRVAAKSIDNRMGCAMLVQTLAALARERPAGTVHLVASVQEEFNVRGVWPAFQALKPDAAICLDVTVACDTPELRSLSDVAVGAGPVITAFQFHGRGTLGGLIPNPKLRRYLEQVAAEAGIPTQREVVLGVITDAAFSQLLGEHGVPMAALSVACRYTHAPVESCSLGDIQAAVDLLSAAARRFDAGIDLSRGD